tara:strand:+ start:387 stop:545 length:159 start_codon:yes stop_codon:yes gene_type:complete
VRERRAAEKRRARAASRSSADSRAEAGTPGLSTKRCRGAPAASLRAADGGWL